MSKPISQLLSTAKYKHLEHTRQDILNVTKYFKSLTPKLERYTFPTGVSKELICLDGTIPVTFRNATYNIPIGIFISDNHPIEAPICYVRPTKDMTIKTSRHVDGSGRVYLPYLSEWNRLTCDLLSTVQVLQVLFGQMCPVYQKAAFDRVSYPRDPAMPPALPNTYNPGTAISGGSKEPTPGKSISMPTPPTPIYPFSSQPQPYSSSDTKPKEKVSQIQDEIEALKKTSEDLNRGKCQLDEMKTRMAKEIEELTEAKSKLQELDDQLQEFIIKYDKEEGDINPDEVYGPTQPLFKQLLEAVAEEQAVCEAIYNTGEGLRKNVITLDVFLKGVRELSRRQFMLRALIRACRNKAALPN